MIFAKAKLRRGGAAEGLIAKTLLDAAEGDAGHALMWTLYGDSADRRRDFLYRELEEGTYLTLSPREPPDPKSLWEVTAKQFAPALAPGDRLAFQLRANPARTAKQAGERGGRARRVDAVMHAKRPAKERGAAPFGPAEDEKAALAWLHAREERLGVAFDREACTAAGYRVRRIGPGPRARQLCFASVDYEGVLEVRDPARLLAALVAGIGKAKAYGCGLMLIRRA
jgi:CRISPR system Cascade subunit CasE